MNLDHLVTRFRAPLTGLLASWGADWTTATELAQDTFVEAYLGKDSFRGDVADDAAVGRWLRGIARNLLRVHRRRKGPKPLDAAATDEVAAPEPVGLSEDAARVRAAIDRLPEKSRTVIYMHYLDEVGVSEVAGLLGTSVRAVEGRLYRARRELRDRLAAMGVGPREENER